MAAHVASVGSCCNDFSTRYGLPTSYNMQDQKATSLIPRVTPYSGWASYKNVKSGQYNRHLCWNCSSAKGFPQSAGVYPVTTANPSISTMDPNYQRWVSKKYDIYQQARMCNNPNMEKYNVPKSPYSTFDQYSNYHDTTCKKLYPKRYVKGNWPDEQLELTKTP